MLARIGSVRRAVPAIHVVIFARNVHWGCVVRYIVLGLLVTLIHAGFACTNSSAESNSEATTPASTEIPTDVEAGETKSTSQVDSNVTDDSELMIAWAFEPQTPDVFSRSLAGYECSELFESEILLCSNCDGDCAGCSDAGDGCDDCSDCRRAPGEITRRLGCDGCDSGCADCQPELSRLEMNAMCDGGCDQCGDSCGRSFWKPGKLVGGFFGDRGGLCDGCCDPCRYISVFGGVNFLDDYSGFRPAPVTQQRGTFDRGFGMGIAVGRKLGNCYRAELEFSYRRNTADDWFVNGVPDRWVGDMNSYSGMTNLYRDLPGLGVLGCVPYLGGGIGFSAVRGDFNTAATSVLVDDFAFAGQLIAGTSKTIGERVDFFGEYRYFAPFEVDFENTGVAPIQVLGTERLDNHGFFFGLRYFR